MSAASPQPDRVPAHFVQCYDGDVRVLAAGAGAFLAEGLRAGGGAIVIATPSHGEAFALHLCAHGIDAGSALRDKRLIFCDAGEVLARFMLHGWPDHERFQAIVEPLLMEIEAHAGSAGVRAYGEMVDLLWNAGQSAAAARLEQLWNELLGRHSFSLFCAYQIDVFGKEFHPSVMEPVLCAHSRLLPAGAGGSVGRAVNRAFNEVLGVKAETLQGLMKSDIPDSWAAVPEAEATILWLRDKLPDYADEVLTRARAYYQAEQFAP